MIPIFKIVETTNLVRFADIAEDTFIWYPNHPEHSCGIFYKINRNMDVIGFYKENFPKTYNTYFGDDTQVNIIKQFNVTIEI